MFAKIYSLEAAKAIEIWFVHDHDQQFNLSNYMLYNTFYHINIICGSSIW